MSNYVKILEHGTVFSQPDRVTGYAAWPSVTRDADGTLVAAFSGNRIMHVCPYGKVLLVKSRDEGKTWSAPIIAVDTPLDDRDAGILNLGDGCMLVSTFNNSRAFQKKDADRGVYGPPERCDMVRAYLPNVTDEMEERYLGSLLSLSTDNGFSWGEPFKVPVTAPHGPNLMNDGSLIYAGAPYGDHDPNYPIAVYRSENRRDFVKLADIPKCPELDFCGYAEPHILQLPDEGGKPGRILLHIRIDETGKPYEERIFTVLQSISDDNGKTWSVPAKTGAIGAPPHLMRHSSGTLICAYGRRTPPYGIQVMFSHDKGDTWEPDYFIWDGGETADLGYPCTVELENGDLFTLYYANTPFKYAGSGATYFGMASIQYTRWRLPE